jgi:transposase
MEDHPIPEPKMPETEVSASSATSSKRSAPKKARRRQFSQSYKRDILEKYETLDTKERGALLRREGLYYSHITKWKWQRQQNIKKTKAAEKKETATVSKARYDAIKKKLDEANAQLTQAQRIIDAQKKLSDLLFEHSRDSNAGSSK